MGNKNLALSKKGRVFEWPREDSERNMKPDLLRFGDKVQIVQIASGSDFSLLLSSSGILYGYGENSLGELGLGDYESKNSP